MEDHGIYGNRPGFVVSVAQALSKTTGSFSKRLRAIIGQVRAELYAGKSHSRDAFLRNQRRLLCVKYAEAKKQDEKVDIEPKPSKKARKNGRYQPDESLPYDTSEQTLIIDHYAHLSRREGYIPTIGGWVLYNTHQQLHYEKNGERKPFKPNIVFPVANDECLLHLVFAYRPFEVPKCETPSTRQVFRLADVCPQDNSNSQQRSNDGMSLEACFCASATCASHLRDDADQLTLLDFLPQLASELISKKTKVTLSEDAKSVLKPFDRSIPRFSAPNMPLCVYYDTYISCGTIYRTRNEECIDCRAISDKDEDPIFSGEMKSWEDAVNIKELLARVARHHPPHYHLQLCSSINWAVS